MLDSVGFLPLFRQSFHARRDDAVTPADRLLGQGSWYLSGAYWTTLQAINSARASLPYGARHNPASFVPVNDHLLHQRVRISVMAAPLGLYRRPFSSVAAMNEGLVEGGNETVGPDDVVWHLGDFAIRQRPAVVAEILARLHGHKHLLTGSNERPATG